jgi:short subunit fatty acids transporter
MAIFHYVFFKKISNGNIFARFEVQRQVDKVLLLNDGLVGVYFFIGFLVYQQGLTPSKPMPALWPVGQTPENWSTCPQMVQNSTTLAPLKGQFFDLRKLTRVNLNIEQ